MDGLNDFRRALGKGEQYRAYQEVDAQRLGGQIPGVMLKLLQQEGWCSYLGQALWLCDPDDWKVVAGLYTDVVPAARVIARTAFGELFLWDGEIFWYLMAHDAVVMWTMDDPEWFFSQVITSSEYRPGPIEAAQARCGRLDWDEMYTFVPALALGGSGDPSTIEKVKAREGLAILAQAQPVERV